MLDKSLACYQTLSVLLSVGHGVRGGQRGLIHLLVVVVWLPQHGWTNGEVEVWPAKRVENWGGTHVELLLICPALYVGVV